MNAIPASRIKFHQGTPYVLATPAEAIPGNCEPDQSPKWFAFTPDFKKMLVGGVATEERLKTIIEADDEFERALDSIL